MIKLNQLNKYFNKNKQQEIHVLNDISLELPEKGLVMLLGVSGSGKTTLLNVMSGLDKLTTGTIELKDQTIKRYKPSQWDRIRNLDIGYIFQNYYLLPDITVYDNIALTLKMTGLTDEEAINDRIEYLLAQVNMENYKSRRASQLSGGQMQRIAIVRALAKNPSIIIADEPTGNLDSKNTLDIMEMLKAIAKEKLVVMVTHEEELARFYADRIIRIKDGKIEKDSANKESGQLDYYDDSDIYLKDLQKLKDLDDEKIKLDYYTDQENHEKVEAKLIIKNQTLYIAVDEEKYKKVRLLNQASDTKIHDAHQTQEEQLAQTKTFDISKIQSDYKKRSNSAINIKDAARMALRKIKESSKLSRLLYVIFALSASVIALAVAFLANVVIIDDREILDYPRNTIVVYEDAFESFEAFYALRELDSVKSLHVFEELIPLRFNMPTYYQSRSAQSINAPAAPISLISNNDILLGRMPQNQQEIVLDQELVEVMLVGAAFQQRGINTYEDVLGLTNTHQFFTDNARNFEVVGISKTGAPVYYLDDSFIASFNQQFLYAREFFQEGELVVMGGRDIENDYEILRSRHAYHQDLDAFKPFPEILNGVEYTVVGVYEQHVNDELIWSTRRIASQKDVMRYHFESSTEYNRPRFLFANDVEQLMQDLDERNIFYAYPFQENYEAERLSRNQTSGGIIVFTTIAFVASGFAFYFVIRSSMISRIYEIGVYRSLGVTKKDLIKIFVIEAVIITTISSAIGFFGTNYILHLIQSNIREAIDIFKLRFVSVSLGLLFIYIINIISALIPITLLLRKTPAEINVKYDL